MISKTIFISISLSIFTIAAFAKTVLFSTDFSTIPSGISASSWQVSSIFPSNYPNASGGNHVISPIPVVTTSYTINLANNISTRGYKNVSVSWGAKKSGGNSVKLFYATGTDINNDGIEDYTEVTGFTDAGTSWEIVTANLPVNDVDNLKLRWTYTSSFLVILGFTNYAVDDLKIEADPDPENIPLPVCLISFTGSSNNNDVALNWLTATENNNDRFEIQKSYDKQNFRYVGEVKGMGTSNTLLSYSFTDKKAFGENLYYRLKQVDTDGNINYSITIKVRCVQAKSNSIYLYPNPATDILYFQLPREMEGESQLDILNLNGAVIKSIFKDETNALNIEDLPPGIYLVKASGKEISFAAKFLKQ